ncbi:hypothetical protein I41_17920 [Lacipirellula limnantheis]|uniref:Uncharacterized protein n=1 Tax=Lacipirellula limnantheis TaxID=2528024 RepID=A0A517TW64_9BACT|nr:hypothetical protein I41_17920 [Lacipirellula limnantheis]
MHGRGDTGCVAYSLGWDVNTRGDSITNEDRRIFAYPLVPVETVPNTGYYVR